jgi:hypothetical protein
MPPGDFTDEKSSDPQCPAFRLTIKRLELFSALKKILSRVQRPPPECSIAASVDTQEDGWDGAA